jgi:hypothetical protein
MFCQCLGGNLRAILGTEGKINGGRNFLRNVGKMTHSYAVKKKNPKNGKYF